MIPHCWCIDAALMIPWRNIDVTAKISMQTLRIIDVFLDLISKLLMFYCCFVDDSLMTLWKDIFEPLIISMETFLIFVFFVVLTSESLIFHCFFIDDSLMTLWRTIDDTTKIWTQMFLINRAFHVQYFNFRCFIAAWLINRCWWVFEETLMRLWWFRCKHYW